MQSFSGPKNCQNTEERLLASQVHSEILLYEKLRQLFTPIEIREDEQAFLCEAGRWLPGSSWSNFLVRWSRALEALGTPSTFVQGLSYHALSVRTSERTYQGTGILAPGNAQRRELMSKQVPYLPAQSASCYPEAFDSLSCFLCQNVAQALDANEQNRPSNAIADLGTHYLLPNRYPAVPGHSLLLKKAHDFPRATRGEILSPDELLRWMTVADALECAAAHNHVHDAMSIPSHDHCHLMPRRFPHLAPLEQLRREYGAYTGRLRAIVSNSTPFEHLVLYGADRRELAAEAAPVLEGFERAGLVTTFFYSDRMLLISHRKEDAGLGPRLSLGAGISFLGFTVQQGKISPGEEDLQLKMPLRPGAFGSIVVSMSDRAVNPPVEYHPLNYDKLIAFGPGLNIKSRLSASEWALWTAALPFQDKRHDLGHAEVVTLFSLLIRDMEHLNEKEKRAAVVASMLHDIGWSQIEKVDEKFISIQARLRSEVSEVQAQARRDDRELRILHQDLGVALARTLLADSEWDDIREEVCSIIGDHDTRDAPPVSRACEVMWDSDMLWRTTLPHANMLEAQAYVPGTQVISAMEKWSRPEHYRTTAARQIAIQEFGVARTQFAPRV